MSKRQSEKEFVGMVPGRLAELLVREKVLSQEALTRAIETSKKANKRLIETLLADGVVDEQNLIGFLSKQYRLPVMDLSNFSPTEDLIKLVPETMFQKHSFVPIGKRGDTLVIAVWDPTDIRLTDEIRFKTRLRVEQVLGLPSVIRTHVEKLGGGGMSALAQSLVAEADGAEALEGQTEETNDSGGEGDAGIVQFASAILVDAVRRKVSDIHIEPYEREMRVRFRIDGDLVEAIKVPPQLRASLGARFKVMSKMRLDEKRLPQDGRIRFKMPEGAVVDFRVNTLPTVFGEKIVLRILDRTNAVVQLDKLGFEKDDLEKFLKAVRQPWGMCLVTGATGSGKTTTLYAAINAINTPDVNISTIEDPVEYNFPGVNQVQAREAIGLTFAETLRALLRQDPDVILLGEIRDGETATVAFKAALTGHMVLSTLHTNDAPSTIMRLKDMGIDTFMLNAAVQVVVAQRLGKKVCQECKAPDERATPELLKQFGFPPSAIGKFQPMIGKGCGRCNGTGFKGRVPLHEVMVMSEALKALVGNLASTEDIRKLAIQEGMKTQKMNAMRKIVAGLMSIDALRELGE